MLERRLGCDRSDELWLAKSWEDPSDAATIGLGTDAADGRKARRQALMFHKTECGNEGPDTTAWRLAGRVACMVMVSGEQQGEFAVLTQRPLVCGRGQTADFRVVDPTVSRTHFEVHSTSAGFVIGELKSRHGVLVNGMKVAGERLLMSGDVIKAGLTELLFYDAIDRRR